MAGSVRAYLFALLLAMLCVAELAYAQSSEDARRAYALSREVMSPYCPGRTLADCPSPDAAALRAEVRGLFASGLDEQAVWARLEERFGDAVIGVPRGVLGWTLPGLVLLAGAGVLVFVLRRISGGEGGSDPGPSDDPELDEELERELRARGL